MQLKPTAIRTGLSLQILLIIPFREAQECRERNVLQSNTRKPWEKSVFNTDENSIHTKHWCWKHEKHNSKLFSMFKFWEVIHFEDFIHKCKIVKENYLVSKHVWELNGPWTVIHHSTITLNTIIGKHLDASPQENDQLFNLLSSVLSSDMFTVNLDSML